MESAIRGIVPALLGGAGLALVFGGHPAISPIITDIGLRLQRTEVVTIAIFQSAFFARTPPDSDLDKVLNPEVYSHIQWTPICRPGDDGMPQPLSPRFALGEHRRMGKLCPYEECTRVPMVIRYPRLDAAPRTDDRIVANIDLAR